MRNPGMFKEPSKRNKPKKQNQKKNPVNIIVK